MKGSKFLKICLCIIGAIFIINQLVASLYMPIKTETATYYTANDGFKITGYIIRGESYVTSDSGGVLHFVTADGIRVAKNGTIANIYSNEDASITVSQIEDIRSQIADIEDILSYNDVEAANLELINSKISESLRDMLFTGAAGNYDEIQAVSEELLSASNRKQAALGVTTGLSERLSALKTELSGLQADLPAAAGKVKAKKSGYFVSKTDGYEKVLTTKDLSEITPEFLSDMKPKKVAENVVGKIVSDYEWYVAATVPLNDSLKYKEGQELKLLTNVKSSPSLSATVEKINISETETDAVIIFKCSDMNSSLATMRSGNMTVVTKEYSGLRISKKALRVVNSVKGVYVQNGMQVNFVPVNIIYRNESYIICEKQNEQGDYLKLYDNVVVKGRNLYDGKIVG